MATIFDIGLVQSFDIVFPVILVWALVFAIFQKTQILGESPAINGVIATAVAFTILLSRTVIDIINFVIPWFAIAILFFIMLLLLFMIFGADAETIKGALTADLSITWVLIGIGIIIIGAGFANVMGQSLLDQRASPADTVAVDGSVAGENFEANIFNTLFHPKVLAFGILFAIAIFAIALLGGKTA